MSGHDPHPAAAAIAGAQDGPPEREADFQRDEQVFKGSFV